MSEFEITEENPITLVEAHNILKKVEKRDKELSFRGNKAKEYLSGFVEKKMKDVKDLKKQLEDLNIPRLRDRHIIKLVDIHPVDMDSLKSLLSAETITVKEEDLKKILAIL